MAQKVFVVAPQGVVGVHLTGSITRLVNLWLQVFLILHVLVLQSLFKLIKIFVKFFLLFLERHLVKFLHGVLVIFIVAFLFIEF